MATHLEFALMDSIAGKFVVSDQPSVTRAFVKQNSDISSEGEHIYEK